MKALLGRKLGMTQIFDENGNVVPVTVIEAGPCVVTQIKTAEADGYDAVQIGFGESKRLSKPMTGHLLKSKSTAAYLKEIRLEASEPEGEEAQLELKVGDKIDVEIFAIGDKVKATGITKGKGFAGTIKRHNFKRGRKTHGSHNYRQPGSIGSMYPEHVFRGKRMAGQMGAEQQTVRNLRVVTVDKEAGLMLVRGAVPGARKSVVLLRSEA